MLLTYESLVQEHQRLLALQKNPPENYGDMIQTFVNNIKQSGQHIGRSSQRDQLRSFLRFWSTVVYEINPSNGYQIVDLDEYTGKVVGNQPKYWTFIAAGGFALVFVVIGLLLSSITPATQPPATETALAALVETITAIVQKPTTPPPSFTPSPTNTPTPTKTPQAPTLDTVSPPTNTPIPAIFSLAITNPKNGDSVNPELEIKVEYKNLPVNWSIQVFVQSISSGNRIFSLPENYLIPEGQTSGEWSFKYDLRDLFPNLETADTYVITAGLANTDGLRKILLDSAQNGLAEMPKEVLWQQNQPVTVNRKAYRIINEVRLIYANYNLRQKQSDLFTALSDGSDVIPLTRTADISEIYPSISPDGMYIAFSGRRENETGKLLNSIWIMTSDGQQRFKLLEKPEIQGFRPTWSSDSRHLAVGVEYPSPNNAGIETIFVFKDVRDQLNQPGVIQNDLSVANYIEVRAEGDNRSPFWISDDEFVFAQSNLANGDLSIISKFNLSTGEIKQLHTIKGAVIDLLPKSDGQYVLTYSKGADRRIYLYNPVTSDLVLLVDYPATNTWLAWLEDESGLLFSTNRSQGNFAIWSIDLATRRQREVIPPLSYQPFVGMLKAYLPIE